MSEGEKYVEMMAPAFVEGLVEPIESFQGDDVTILRLYMRQVPIKHLLQEVAWEKTGLTSRVFHDPERVLTPGQYAERLMAFAFDDVHKIFKIVEKSQVYISEQQELPLGQLLLNGQRSLLLVGRLADKHRSRLLDDLDKPEFANLYADPVMLSEEPLTIVGDGKTASIEWGSEVTEWIRDRLDPSHGCPAYNKTIVTPDGDKQKLMNYFWEKLVAATYPNQ